MERDAEFETAVREEWEMAIEHAGLGRDRCRLWFGRGAHQDAASAQYYVPVRSIDGEHGLSDEQLAEAHSEECSGHHRVIVYPNYEPEEDELEDEVTIAVFGASLRHELQHALQFEACGPDVFDLDDALVDRVLSVRAAELPGSMALYNTKPMEIDGNAASAMYLCDVHPDEVDRIRAGPCGQLGRSLVGPENPNTLLARTVCFLYLHRDVCRQIADDIPVVNWIRTYSKEGASIWESLESTAEAGSAFPA